MSDKKTESKRPTTRNYKRKYRQARDVRPEHEIKIPEAITERREKRIQKELIAAQEAGKSAKQARTQSARELITEKVELLQMEWALFHPEKSVLEFITVEKGYSKGQYCAMTTKAPVSEWKARKEVYQNKIAMQVAERHIDKIAEMNDQHIKAGRLGLVKGLQLLSQGVTGVVKKTGKKFQRDLYPQEYNFVMQGIKTAQQVYRTAMGMPGDSEGMRQLLEDLARRNQTAVQNIQINLNQSDDKTKDVSPKEDGISKLKALMDGLSHDELKVFVERKREKLKAELNGSESST